MEIEFGGCTEFAVHGGGPPRESSACHEREEPFVPRGLNSPRGVTPGEDFFGGGELA